MSPDDLRDVADHVAENAMIGFATVAMAIVAILTLSFWVPCYVLGRLINK